ncbi:MAG: hypothetical protein H5U40_11320, partial [Polyangiaceae bacterium]|nr:hypothetical protein [Polyangiaceae bacterium]
MHPWLERQRSLESFPEEGFPIELRGKRPMREPLLGRGARLAEDAAAEEESRDRLARELPVGYLFARGDYLFGIDALDRGDHLAPIEPDRLDVVTSESSVRHRRERDGARAR